MTATETGHGNGVPPDMDDSDKPSVVELLARVMADVGAVGKDDQNRQQNYRFRGVDAVVNAVGPALRKHGVVMFPHAGIPIEEKYQSKGGATMTRVVLPVTFAFHGPAGDVVDCHVYGESSDAGDKAMSKAHSVAWRVALLQVFAIPTDDPDPDEHTHERASADPEPAIDWKGLGWDGRRKGADHDDHLERCRTRARALGAEDKAELKAWIDAHDVSLPYERSFMEEWSDEIDRLAGVTEGERVAAPRSVEDTADPTLLDEGRPFTED